MATIGDLVVNLTMNNAGLTRGVHEGTRGVTQFKSSVAAANPIVAGMSRQQQFAGENALRYARALKQATAAQETATSSGARYGHQMAKNATLAKRGSSAMGQLAFAVDDFANSQGSLSNRLRGVSNNLSTILVQSGGVQGAIAGMAIALLPSLVEALTGSEAAMKKVNKELKLLDENLNVLRRGNQFDRDFARGLVDTQTLVALRDERDDLRDELEKLGNESNAVFERKDLTSEARLKKRLGIEEKIVAKRRELKMVEEQLQRIGNADREQRRSRTDPQAIVRGRQQELAILKRQRDEMRAQSREIARQEALRDDRIAVRNADREGLQGLQNVSTAVELAKEAKAREKARKDAIRRGEDPDQSPLTSARRGSVEAARAVANASRGDREKTDKRIAKSSEQTAKTNAELLRVMSPFARRRPVEFKPGSIED